ncbi:MAG: hypothetical protein RLZZ574_2257 [Cyanobacteriota bacterium]|jgi:hypothetical protein
MAKNSSSESITIRCPSLIVDSIDQQVKQTKQNKTDVIVGMLSNSIPCLHITERAKLPSLPGIYFVYTLDHKILYVGKADNLRTRWNSHHRYQYFIETSMESRIGYFVLESVDKLDDIVEEFNAEPMATVNSKALVTADELELVKQELAVLKQQFKTTFSALAELGLSDIAQRLEASLPPRGKQDWTYDQNDRREGLTRSELIKRVGFGSTKEFENALNIHSVEDTAYLEELSGWSLRPIEEGSSRTRFFPRD